MKKLAELTSTDKGAKTVPEDDDDSDIRARSLSVVSCTQSQKDHHESRGGWTNKTDFFFSIMGSVVGLGALWRFPFLVYKHGGGAFIIIFLISMGVLGIPLFFLEILMGQYCGVSQVDAIAQLAPIMKGIGYSFTSIVFYFCTYYAVILGWIIYYFVASFSSIPGLPWTGCDHSWNTEKCFDVLMPNESFHRLMSYNISVNQSMTAVEEFWNINVLGISQGIEELKGIRWELAGCLFLSWFVIYFIIWKGLHSSGKVIWFTAIFPYVIMLILLCRAATLEGAADGLLFYIRPKWDRMADPQAWIDGGTQVAFAYSVGTGALYALGSYNKYDHKLYRDVMIVGLISPFTALFAGCVTFSVLGFLASQLGMTVEQVIQQGPGLTFIAYPQVVALMAGSPFWALIFFFMMLLIGINSQFAAAEGFIMAIVDDWPRQLTDPKRRFLFNLLTCLVFFVLGMPMVTMGGPYIFQLIDSFGVSGMPLLWALIFEILVISWCWGTDKVVAAVEDMTSMKLSFVWKICWSYLCPIYMTSLFIFNLIKYKPVTYGDDYQYPWWGQLLGWLIGMSVMLWIPGYFLYYLFTEKGTLRERLIKGFTSKIRKRPGAQSSKRKDVELTKPVNNVNHMSITQSYL